MASQQEWLVSDQRGAFAMGTVEGFRTRKYHGFLMGIAGRSEKAYLVDLDFECDGKSLWSHCYMSPEGTIYTPPFDEPSMEFQNTPLGPMWEWELPHGKLRFTVEAAIPSGIILRWKWRPRSKKPTAKPVVLRVRGFWAMRDLHAVGGKPWASEVREASNQSTLEKVVGEDGTEAFCLLHGNWQREEIPLWYRNFHYTEELERGYGAEEDLFSAEVLQFEFKPSQQECSWQVSHEAFDEVFDETFEGAFQGTPMRSRPRNCPQNRPKTADFILTRPAGIVAGFPWFGEWGRDTFIALPGIVASSLKSGEDPVRVWVWTQELLRRWGNWIEKEGMLPNLLRRDGSPQWESADATLWWCHSLASLWMLSLCTPFPFFESQNEFSRLLSLALDSIHHGRHRFLKTTSAGLIEVTDPHTTWMDARIDGISMTPRIGLLPEMNALWFEARCLQWLWSDLKNNSLSGSFENRSFENDLFEVEKLARAALTCREPDRPNTIFLHSLPLAPSFVIGDWNILETDLLEIAENFWTPLGLKTLRPSDPHFRPRCVGSQRERDRVYHQGAPWGWLGGQFEIARHRLAFHKKKQPNSKQDLEAIKQAESLDKMFNPGVLENMPIEGHIPELFDAEPPYHPRGAPAQAWSLACIEEDKARWKLKVDARLTKILAQRWMGREQRKIHRDGQDHHIEAQG
jgi:glycogen debranching enzyme